MSDICVDLDKDHENGNIPQFLSFSSFYDGNFHYIDPKDVYRQMLALFSMAYLASCGNESLKTDNKEKITWKVK